MKHGRNPTLAQKRAIKHLGLDPTKWLVIQATKARLLLSHRITGTIQEVTLQDA